MGELQQSTEVHWRPIAPVRCLDSIGSRAYFANSLKGRLMTFKWFAMTEERFGNLFACAPAIRQFVAYYQRVGTSLPTYYRQDSNQDFVKMRHRINLRDVFWYRKAETLNGRVLEARPIFQKAIEPPPMSTSEDLQSMAQSSVLDLWLKRIKGKTSVSETDEHSKSFTQKRLF